MKTIFKNSFLALLFVVLFAACQKDAYEPKNSLAEASWHISTGTDQLQSPLIINPGQYVVFMDLSQGYISHEWDVQQENVYFMEGELDWGDNDYEALVNYDAPHVTDKETIFLYFPEPGQHKVRLRNVFPKQVRYPYTLWDDVLKENVNLYKYGEQQGDVFVMDTTFIVDIYDPIVKPSARVYRSYENGVLSDEIETGFQNGKDGEFMFATVGYGETLYFQDTSTDRPNTWTWTSNSTTLGLNRTYEGIEHLGHVLPVTFTELTSAPNIGVSKNAITLSLAATRTNTTELSGNKLIPTAQKVTAQIPLNIAVIPSTKPLEYTVTQVDQQSIRFEMLNSEFAEGVTFDPANFSLTYENDYDGRALVSGNVAIASVAVAEGSKNALVVTLTDMIYNTDRLTFSSVNPSENVLFDGQSLTITATEPNVKTYFFAPIFWDFEDGGDFSGWKAFLRAAPFTEFPAGYMGVVDNPLPSEGNQKAFYADGAGNTDAFGVTQPFLVVSNSFDGVNVGQVNLSYKVYFEPTQTFPSTQYGVGIGLDFTPTASTNPQHDVRWTGVFDDAGKLSGTGIYTQLASKNSSTPMVKLGEWLSLSATVKTYEDIQDIRTTIDFNAYGSKVWIDDMLIENVEVRP